MRPEDEEDDEEQEEQQRKQFKRYQKRLTLQSVTEESIDLRGSTPMEGGGGNRISKFSGGNEGNMRDSE